MFHRCSSRTHVYNHCCISAVFFSFRPFAVAYKSAIWLFDNLRGKFERDMEQQSSVRNATQVGFGFFIRLAPSKHNAKHFRLLGAISWSHHKPRFLRVISRLISAADALYLRVYLVSSLVSSESNSLRCTLKMHAPVATLLHGVPYRVAQKLCTTKLSKNHIKSY